MMKIKLFALPLIAGLLLFSACDLGGTGGFVNPGDLLGGGNEAEYTPPVTDSDATEEADNASGEAQKGEDIPSDAQPITKKTTIGEAGDYVLSGEIEGKIEIASEGVRLFLENASLSNEKKVIDSAYSLTITLSGENYAENTNPDGSNAIDCAGDLLINGTGSLTVTSTKNAIKGGTVTVTEGQLVLNAAGDGIHAEIDAYDGLTDAPVFSYEDGGWVVIDGADVTIESADDGIQADTFVKIKGESKLSVKTNGGAPQTITEQSSDSGNGKGIKAGAIDYGPNDDELTEGDYLIAIEGGQVKIDANDDAIHSDSEIVLSGGTLELTSGDDAVHAEKLLSVTGGKIAVSRCYEGLEAAKVEISGGEIGVIAADDGINAADGTQNPMGQANNNCHIIISGGIVCVNAEGDGVDSNGSLLISGGELYVSGPQNGANAALDSDGGILINGGYLFAVGPLGMVETPASNSGQNCVSYAYSGTISAGTVLSLTDSEGKAIFSYTAEKACRSVIISCPELVKGSAYKIYGGDAELCSFTVSQTITTVGSQGGMGGPGTAPPGGFGGGMGGPGGGFGHR